MTKKSRNAANQIRRTKTATGDEENKCQPGHTVFFLIKNTQKIAQNKKLIK